LAGSDTGKPSIARFTAISDSLHPKVSEGISRQSTNGRGINSPMKPLKKAQLSRSSLDDSLILLAKEERML
jgi:hypothetical protein